MVKKSKRHCFKDTSFKESHKEFIKNNKLISKTQQRFEIEKQWT